ncbi:efflux RND transporter permease subunit [bacterium]|nr:MAG: efflux RND transporter permease subunit [bacterium]
MIGMFLRRPVLTAVCSLIILIAGAVVVPTLPIAQYPRIAPPVVTVNAAYIGADAQTVESAVTTPLEQAINGVEGLRYISSTSSNNGGSTITCTFRLGTNLETATTDVQNAVQSAMGRLPDAVKQTGVTVSKNAGTFVMAIALVSDTPKYGPLFLSNYADLNLVNALKRVAGVSDVRVFGSGRYAMRIWIDPRKLAQYGLAASDVIGALEEQNVNVAAGAIGSQPAPANQPYTYTVRAVGRLTSPDQFRQIVLRAAGNGGYVRLGDVAKIDLGSESYDNAIRFDGNTNSIGLGVLQLPTANALSVSQAVRAQMNELAKAFPPGVHYEIAFDTSVFVHESIKEVLFTLLFSIVLVILVIYLFLQDPRATLIPAVSIPVSLIGTFMIMKLFGFTINTITLFGLTLATGLVVDDAIVVIENIARFIQEKKMGGIKGAEAAMHEVQGAVVASSLVLISVFVPVAFFPGTTGQLYKQFALTIAASISISLFVSLSLSPMLSSRLFREQHESHFPPFVWFNRGLSAFRARYRRLLPVLLRARWAVFGVFVLALALTGWLFKTTPTAFIPDEDQGYFIVTEQAPEGTSLGNEMKIADRVERIIRQQPEVQHIFDVAGFSFTGSEPNRGIMFVNLKPWAQRQGSGHTLSAILGRLRGPLFGLAGAQVFAFNPPAIQGVGNFGGFQYELEDRGNVGLPALTGTAFGYMMQGNRDPDLSSVFTTFRIDSPQLLLNVDRDKAKAVGVSLSDLFGTLQAELGSVYVNDFNYLSRSYRVYVQADEPYRGRIASLGDLYVRSSAGGIAPVTEFVSPVIQKGAPIINHYNLYRSIEINGQPAPGKGTGQAIAAMEQLAQRIDPSGVAYEWSGLSLDEIEAGFLTMLIFALGILFTFLVLSAQYESFADPLIVLLAVPAALLGALLLLGLRHIPSDAYAQVGYVMLIGLASKNAILIVEFANEQLREGADIVTAASRAAQTRLRPILMTSIAFVVAVLPLVFASGAGANARHSLGTVVCGGMLLATFLNLAITPVIYVIVKSASRRGRELFGRGRNGQARALEEEPVPVGEGHQ